MKKSNLVCWTIFLLCLITGCGGGEFSTSKECAALEQIRLQFIASNVTLKNQNQLTINSLNSAIDGQIASGRTEWKWLKPKVVKIQAQVAVVLQHLQTLSEKLKSIAGIETNGSLRNADETDQNALMWGISKENRGRGNGEAFILHRRLRAYEDALNTWDEAEDSLHRKRNRHFVSVAVDPSEDPFVPANVDKSMPWERYNFEGTNVIMDLVSLERIQQAVLQSEADLLGDFQKWVGYPDGFSADSLALIVVPRSREVVPGAVFEANVFLGLVDSDLMPQFGGEGITVNPKGTSATFRMIAPGDFNPGENSREQAYSFHGSVPAADGSQFELRYRGSYTVRRPELVIRSTNLQHLYRNCQNTIHVDVPEMGKEFNPVFKATDAEIILHPEDRRTVTIVPIGAECILDVTSESNGKRMPISGVKYGVIAPPRPRIGVEVLGKEYDGMTPISLKLDWKIKVVPDEGFRLGFPRDARYVIDKIDLLVARSLGAPTKVRTVEGNGKDAIAGIIVRAGEELRMEPPGTKLFLKIGAIHRMNFQNKKIQEPFSARELTIGFVIK